MKGSATGLSLIGSQGAKIRAQLREIVRTDLRSSRLSVIQGIGLVVVA
jgi:hypothetical protein